MRAVPAGPLQAGIETKVAHALCNSLAQDGLALRVEVEVGREVGEALQDAARVHRLAVLLCNMARLKKIKRRDNKTIQTSFYLQSCPSQGLRSKFKLSLCSLRILLG
jgi:hypothetical protein